MYIATIGKTLYLRIGKLLFSNGVNENSLFRDNFQNTVQNFSMSRRLSFNEVCMTLSEKSSTTVHRLDLVQCSLISNCHNQLQSYKVAPTRMKIIVYIPQLSIKMDEKKACLHFNVVWLIPLTSADGAIPHFSRHYKVLTEYAKDFETCMTALWCSSLLCIQTVLHGVPACSN